MNELILRSYKIFIISILFISLLSCSKEDITEPEDNSEGYSLVWSDEFDTDGLPNPRYWGYEYGFKRNRELQYYKSTNSWCEGGLLVIEARRDSFPNPIYDSTSSKWLEQRKFAEYTSASLHTQNRQSWMYGRIEMRAKINIGSGLWPAFWTQGVSGGWPYNGEIDIMEYYQENVLANFAWGSAQKGKAIWDASRTPVSELGGHDWADEFHIWRIDWDSLQISIYLDDELMNEVDLSETVNQDAEGKNPFLQKHYIIINLAVGGNAGGDLSHTIFPVYYYIDYVRVYQRL